VRLRLVLSMLLFSVFALAQQPPVNSPLLDHLVGNWVMEGTMAREHRIDDVQAEWVLDHHYLRIHEKARTKNSKGQLYEAFIHIAWNDEKWPGGQKRYSCAWLDVWGGLSEASLGVAIPKDNELPFIFKNEKGEPDFSNVFVYDPATDTWEWRLDNIDKGQLKPFGRMKLTRKK
jgi:hypothetical protein